MRLCGELCLQAKLGVRMTYFRIVSFTDGQGGFSVCRRKSAFALKPKAENVTESFTTTPWQEIMKQAGEEMLPLIVR